MTHETFMPSAWMMPVLIQDTPQGGGLIGGPSSSSTTTQPGSPVDGGAGQQGRPAGGMDMMFMILVLFGGMLLITMFSGRKEKKRRKEMMASMGKKDKVRTAGGIIGTIVEMKGDEVLIETDRASHTRLWLAKGSISSIEKHAKSSGTAEEETQSTGA
jgi:preprotein translocase subunit YajC